MHKALQATKQVTLHSHYSNNKSHYSYRRFTWGLTVLLFWYRDKKLMFAYVIFSGFRGLNFYFYGLICHLSTWACYPNQMFKCSDSVQQLTTVIWVETSIQPVRANMSRHMNRKLVHASVTSVFKHQIGTTIKYSMTTISKILIQNSQQLWSRYHSQTQISQISCAPLGMLTTIIYAHLLLHHDTTDQFVVLFGYIRWRKKQHNNSFHLC